MKVLLRLELVGDVTRPILGLKLCVDNVDTESISGSLHLCDQISKMLDRLDLLL